MKKQGSIIEWQVVEDERAWEHLCATCTPGRMPSVQACQQWHPAFRAVTVILLLVTAVVGWCCIDWGRSRSIQAAPSGQPLSEATLVQSKLYSFVPDAIRNPSGPGRWLQHSRETDNVRAAIQSSERTDARDITVETVEVQEDQAVARIVITTTAGRPAYRQTRFYRYMDARWIRTNPDAALWGPEHRLETPAFVYHFRQHDAPVVIAVAPQVEALFTSLRQNVGLPLTLNTEKLIIEVRVTQPPGQATPGSASLEHIQVPSPAVYLAPVELTDAELLLQSIALPLLKQVAAQASKQYAIGAAWQPLLRGLSLWTVWDLDLPLATWRRDIVKWIYVSMPGIDSAESSMLPEHYAALCRVHKLWVTSPMELVIPLLCARPRWEEQNLWRLRHPLLHLNQLAPQVDVDEYVGQASDVDWTSHPGRGVALALLIEYGVATYGRDRLPLFVASLGQHDSWETLLPAVYGISSAQFEAGWQAYLKTQF
jgi:hypothetical protein